MSLFAITSLSVTLCCFTLAILIFIYAKSPLHRIWALFNFSCAIWAVGTFFAAIAKTPWQAELAWRWAYGLGSFVPYVFYHFNYIFCELKKPKMLRVVFGLSFFFFILNSFSPTFNDTIIIVFGSLYYTNATIHYSIFLIYLTSIVIISFKELLHFSRNCTGTKKTQALYLLFGFGVGWSGGFVTFLPAYGIWIYPAWNFVVCLYVLLMTYAIFKHHLMDIRVVIQKSLLYTLLISVLTVLFIICIYVTERFLQNIVGYQSLISSIFAATILAVTFIPLRNLIQGFVDYLFFHKTPCEMEQENLLLRDEAAQKEKFKAVAALASGIVHEIRNPVSTLKTFYEYFPIKKDDARFIKKFQALTARELTRIESLMQNLLDFAKPTAPSFERISIAKVLTDVLELITQKAHIHKVSLKKDLCRKNVKLKLDSNQIKQALLNICLNAIDAMDEGGTLSVKSKLKGKFYLIEIADTGPGIPQKSLPHIFEPFYSEKKSGTGLGLAITKTIIEKHRGRVCVKSEAGGGTKFIIKLSLKLQE